MWLKGVQNHSHVDQIFHDTETSYSELCRMHTWCSENGIALVTYQEILNKMKVQMICSLEAYRN